MNPPAMESATAFSKKLSKNVPHLRTHSLPQSDLAGSFPDRDQHDVHDADTANDQRNRCHPRQH